MNLEDWKSQIKRGTLEFCILLLIRRKPTYGYEMISTLEQYPIVAAKENTIYPLLRRLQKEGYLLLLAGERRGPAPQKVLCHDGGGGGLSGGHVRGVGASGGCHSGTERRGTRWKRY